MPQSPSPLVSVIVPAYNAGKFIRETLTSILGQSYRNLEIIVVDDGSTDETADIVKSIAANDSRLVLASQSNQGVAMARNRGIEMSRGEYIAPVDADDIWYLQKIEKQIRAMVAYGSKTGLVYTWFTILNEEGSMVGKGREWKLEGQVYFALVYANFVGNGSTPLIRRSCIDRVGLYDPDLRAQGAEGCEDWDLYLRIAKHYEYRVIPEYLVGYRKYLGNMSSDYHRMTKSQWIVLNEVKRKYPEVPAKIFRWVKAKNHFRFSILSFRKGDYLQVLSLAQKTLRLDPWSILSYRLMNIAVKSLLRIATQPILRSIESFIPTNGKSNQQNGTPIHKSQSLNKISRKNTPFRRSLNLYDKIYQRRLQSIVEK